MPDIKIKWIIADIDNIGISEDSKVWRLPYDNGDKYYPLKEIKPHLHLGMPYYRIFQKRYSKEKLNRISIKLRKPKIYYIPDKKDVPF